MKTFFDCRGRVFSVKVGDQSQSGFTALQPAITSSTESPVLLMSADPSESAAVTTLSALNDRRIMYLHGRHFTQMSLNGIVMLGSGASGGGAGFKAVKEWFEQNVVTTSAAPINVSMPGRVSYKMYVIGLSWGATDPNFHIKPFVITGYIANLPTR
jgi:hypothetical protein